MEVLLYSRLRQIDDISKSESEFPVAKWLCGGEIDNKYV